MSTFFNKHRSVIVTVFFVFGLGYACNTDHRINMGLSDLALLLLLVNVCIITSKADDLFIANILGFLAFFSFVAGMIVEVNIFVTDPSAPKPILSTPSILLYGILGAIYAFAGTILGYFLLRPIFTKLSNRKSNPPN